jgi:isoamylase
VIEHLTGLGVTAVELLPVHQSVTNGALRAKGLANYWGYDTIGFFAPHAGYSAAMSHGRPGGQVREFKQMVRTLHHAGLEVLLDVVFNHTAEGNEYGPTLFLRGLDNLAYYRLVPGDPRHYFDTTGTGNSLNVDDTGCLRMILDSLRYWVLDMHVDGFRFDLATTLAREGGDFSRVSSFFDLVAQDPVVSQVKLIAEPWDVGQQDSYALGRFPALWSEWNGRFRDTVRDFWRSQDGTLADFATRVAGSADLYGGSRRRPSASVNLITAHDGFTLGDLVSYDRKHNEENGEGNRDGSDDNRSWNSGAEGPTDDADVLAARAARSRAMLATLLLSLGVPMLLGGDELGRSQAGNNNAYCQDGPVSWYDWTAVDTELLAYTRRLLSLRRAHPAFRRRRFVRGARPGEVDWFTPAGQPMTAERWQDPLARSVTAFIDGSRDPDRDAHGRPLLDDDLLLLINGYWEPLDFTLPLMDARWRLALDTAHPTAPEAPVPPGTPVTVGAWSLLLLVGARRSGE